MRQSDRNRIYMSMKLVIVTATTSPDRAYPCFKTWGVADGFVGVVNGRPWEPKEKPEEQVGTLTRDWLISPEYLGSVSAFRLGVDFALKETDADIIACLHDDVEIHDQNWVLTVKRHFERHPACGLAGFGGALGLGDADIYQKPYAPMQLARVNFRSNLVNAEMHGIRSLVPERVACLDGFSQIGRRAFWEGSAYALPVGIPEWDMTDYSKTEYLGQPRDRSDRRPWTVLERIACVHHCYDSALGAIAGRYGWEAWYLPVRCRHLGGVTAVGDQGYQEWAKTKNADGDYGFWEASHRACYDEFRDILPIRV